MNRIEEFEKPDLEVLTWKGIFDLYDRNFSMLYSFLNTLGTSYKVESFTNTTLSQIDLVNEFVVGDNQLMVFINGVIQWVGVDYTEVNSHRINLTVAPELTDDIIIMVIYSFNFVADIQQYVSEIIDAQNAVSETKDLVDAKYLLFGEIYNLILAETEKMRLMEDNVEGLITQATSIETAIRELVESLEGQTSGTSLAEIITARRGFASLSEILDKFVFHFESTADMIACTQLKAGDLVNIATITGLTVLKVMDTYTGELVTHTLANGLKAVEVQISGVSSEVLDVDSILEEVFDVETAPGGLDLEGVLDEVFGEVNP